MAKRQTQVQEAVPAVPVAPVAAAVSAAVPAPLPVVAVGGPAVPPSKDFQEATAQPAPQPAEPEFLEFQGLGGLILDQLCEDEKSYGARAKSEILRIVDECHGQARVEAEQEFPPEKRVGLLYLPRKLGQMLAGSKARLEAIRATTGGNKARTLKRLDGSEVTLYAKAAQSAATAHSKLTRIVTAICHPEKSERAVSILRDAETSFNGAYQEIGELLGTKKAKGDAPIGEGKVADAGQVAAELSPKAFDAAVADIIGRIDGLRVSANHHADAYAILCAAGELMERVAKAQPDGKGAYVKFLAARVRVALDNDSINAGFQAAQREGRAIKEAAK